MMQLTPIVRRQFLVLIGILALVVGSSCTDDPPTQPSAPEPSLPEPTSPANVLLALEQLYEDDGISPSRRASEYANLLVPPDRGDIPPFRFRYGYCDIECPEWEWGFVEETRIHEKMLNQDRRVLLDLHTQPDFDATGIWPDRPGWRVIYADNVRISVWLGDTETTAFTASEQIFFFAPADGRWYLAEWLERNSGTMWASLKSTFDSGAP